MVSNLLYEKRFGPYFIEPIIAALDPKTNQPFISVMYMIGQQCICEDFAVAGCASEQLYGMCEALWQPNLVSFCRIIKMFLDAKTTALCIRKEADDLFETISQALMNAFDRDAYSGWGAVVYLM